jgi:hypothetical protein
MKRTGLPTLITALVLAITSLCACSTQPLEKDNNLSTVRIVATENFGRELMFDEALEVLPGTSAMAALMKVAEVKTAYGGGFVNSINGVRSTFTGKEHMKADWFIYVNGIQSNIGALDYELHDGDIQHWDFHDWSFRQFVPAIIGDFPEPFLHGYGGVVYPTVIAFQDGWEDSAEHMADRLSQLGVASIASKNISELLADEKQSSNLILLGTTDCKLIEEVNQAWDSVGFYIHFQSGSLKVCNSKGSLAAEYRAGAGFIQATQSPWNPSGIGACQNVFWVVSGLDETGVKNALDILMNHHNDFEYACASVIADGEIIKVP